VLDALISSLKTPPDPAVIVWSTWYSFNLNVMVFPVSAAVVGISRYGPYDVPYCPACCTVVFALTIPSIDAVTSVPTGAAAPLMDADP